MQSTIHFLLLHGYVVIFAWVFLEQAGAPIPTIPLFLAVGALAGRGMLNFGSAVALAVAGSFIADFLWYIFGRLRGASVLTRLCQISLEPDSCVRQAQDRMVRHGSFSLLIAKFIPGLSLAAPPIAGMTGMSVQRFALLDVAAAVVWATAFSGLGYAFSGQLARVAEYSGRMGAALGILLLAAFAAYLAAKYRARRSVLRQLRTERIAPAAVKAKLDSGEPVAIIDLRHGLDFAHDPYTLPGAFHFEPEDLDRRYKEIPLEREIILYCS